MREESLSEQIDKLKNMLSESSDDDFDYEMIKDEFGLDIKELESQMLNYKPRLSLGYKKLHPDAVTPKYNYESDSGFDLHSVVDTEIPPLKKVLIPTGLSFDINDGYEIQVRSKSGLALKQGLMVLNSPGTVDNGYTGEVQVIVFNTNNYAVSIPKGMKIAQAVLCPVVNGGWVRLEETKQTINKDRNENGFGSTGI
jgi:dUTP pyrophosphatase